MSDSSRIVVTGIGLMTPVGSNRESSWRGLLAGKPAIRQLDESWVGAPSFCGSADDHTAEPVVLQALIAAREAVADAALKLRDYDRTRVGCVIGTSKGGFRSLTRCFTGISPSSRHPEFFMQAIPDAAALAVQGEFDIHGPSLVPVAACATGLMSIAQGAQLIAAGICDYVLAGSSDASLSEIVLASYRRLGVLAHGFSDPARACRPFDQQRNGFVIGEGAAVLILEREETARDRGVRPYGEWVTAGFGSDPSGLLQIEADPIGLTYILKDVLRRARVDARDLDYVNLHGTGTRDNDRYETRALRAALGSAADGIPASSLKGTIGHLLGGAGSVELAATFLAMRDGLLPPTANLDVPDPECDLDYVPREARVHPVHHAVKVSLGFGGHLTAALIRSVSESRPPQQFIQADP